MKPLSMRLAGSYENQMQLLVDRIIDASVALGAAEEENRRLQERINELENTRNPEYSSGLR